MAGKKRSAVAPERKRARTVAAPVKNVDRRRRTPGVLVGLLLTVGALAGAGAWWLHSRQAAAAPVEPMEPAEQAVRAKAEREPGNADAQHALGLYLLERARPYEAIWAFQNALELRRTDGESRRGMARALIAARLPRLALKTLAEAVGGPEAAGARPSDDLEQRRVAADAYMAMGDPVGAVGVLSSPATQADTEGLLKLGMAYEALGDDAPAAAAYRRHLKLASDSVDGYLALSRLAVRARRWREAFSSLTEAQRTAPADPRPFYEFGRALRAQRGDAADNDSAGGAVALFQRALSLRPDYGPAQWEIGLWHQRQRHAAEAATAMEQAIAAGAGGGEAHLQLAQVLERDGRKAAACYQRGLYYMTAQQPARAVPQFEQMAALDTASPDGFLMLCAAYVKLNQNGRAADAARLGLQRHPDDPRMLARRAMLLLMADNRTEGASLCREWLRKQPGAAEPYRLLGSIAREELHYAEAVHLCQEAMSRDPKNAEYCREAARALLGDPSPGNLRQAATVLRRGIALAPEAGETRLQIADVLQRLGDIEGAREQYLRGMDRSPDDRRGPLGLSQLCPRLGKSGRVGFYAQIARALQDREDTARALWRRVFQDPGDTDAHARLAALLLEAGDLDQARYQLQQTAALQPGRRAEQRQLLVVERLLALRQS